MCVLKQGTLTGDPQETYNTKFAMQINYYFIVATFLRELIVVVLVHKSILQTESFIHFSPTYMSTGLINGVARRTVFN